MPTDNQMPKGKVQTNILLDEQLKATVQARAKELKITASDVFIMGAMTFLNNGNRPITREEIIARDLLKNLPEENLPYLQATADFLKKSENKTRFNMLKMVLGEFFDARFKGKEKNAPSLQAA